jgi:hypothetical protein
MLRWPTLVPVFIVLVAVAFLMWQVVKLVLTTWGRIQRRRSRPDLLGRLAPYQVPHQTSVESVADEAQEWLDRQA